MSTITLLDYIQPWSWRIQKACITNWHFKDHSFLWHKEATPWHYKKCKIMFLFLNTVSLKIDGSLLHTGKCHSPDVLSCTWSPLFQPPSPPVEARGSLTQIVQPPSLTKKRPKRQSVLQHRSKIVPLNLNKSNETRSCFEICICMFYSIF